MPKAGDEEGGSSHIRTFLRIRPSTRPSGFINVDEFDKKRLDFHVPVEHRDGEVGGWTVEHRLRYFAVGSKKRSDCVISYTVAPSV